jgi:hypothetical protein
MGPVPNTLTFRVEAAPMAGAVARALEVIVLLVIGTVLVELVTGSGPLTLRAGDGNVAGDGDVRWPAMAALSPVVLYLLVGLVRRLTGTPRRGTGSEAVELAIGTDGLVALDGGGDGLGWRKVRWWAEGRAVPSHQAPPGQLAAHAEVVGGRVSCSPACAPNFRPTSARLVDGPGAPERDTARTKRPGGTAGGEGGSAELAADHGDEADALAGGAAQVVGQAQRLAGLGDGLDLAVGRGLPA